MSDAKYMPVMSKPELDAVTEAICRMLGQIGAGNPVLTGHLNGALEKLDAAKPAAASQLDLVEAAANMQTWEEHCVIEAINEYGLRDYDAIRDHIDSASTDLDYLTGQDETLESLIQQARAVRGTARSLNDVIANALADVPAEGLEP